MDAERLARLVGMCRSDSQNDSLYRHCIDSALQAAAFDVVMALAQERMQMTGEDPMARFDLANGLIGQGDYMAALAQLARLPRPHADHAAVLMNRGLCHYCLGQYSQAMTLLESCYLRGDRQAGLLRLLVSSLHHLGKLEAAIPIAAEAAEAASNDAALAGVLALFYLDMDELPKARRWARTALQLDPQSVDGRVVEATLLTVRLQKQRAQELLQAVVAEVPQTGRAWLGLGTLALIDQDLTRARQFLERGLELLPAHVGSWHALGWTHVVGGDLAAARGAFDQAMSLDRNFAETHGGLASVAALRGETAHALALIATARRLDRGCLSATFAEATLQAQAGDPEQARRSVSDAVAGLTAGDGGALAQLLTHISRVHPSRGRPH